MNVAPLTKPTLHRDPTAMKFDKLPAWSQSESRTLDLLGAGKVRPDDLQALRGGVCLRTEMKQFAVVPHDDTEVGAAQHPRTVGDGIEDGLDVAR